MLTQEKVMETKRIVKRAMKGFLPEEKTRAWRAVYNYMQIANLQQETANEGRDLELGEGNYAADIVIVTQTKPIKAEMEVFRNILRAIDIPETQVYRTMVTGYDVREILIINPAVAIYFGDPGYMPAANDRTKILITYPLSAMLPDAPDSQTMKTEAWQSLKEIMKHYDEVMEREKV